MKPPEIVDGIIKDFLDILRICKNMNLLYEDPLKDIIMHSVKVWCNMEERIKEPILRGSKVTYICGIVFQ